MRILHVLDHSLPTISGYSLRSRSIVLFQRGLGLDPVVVTSPKHGDSAAAVEDHDGIRHHRTVPRRMNPVARVPVARELALMATLTRRIGQVARAERPDVIHASGYR